MRRFGCILLGGVGVLLAILLVGPFLVPIPPLEGTVGVEALTGEDSRFMEVNGITIHYQSAGEGEPALILLHGFLSSVFTWRETLPALAADRQVIAFDRPAFGLTERPLVWEGENPYSPEAQVELVVGMMDELGLDQAILVGNSAGGAIATQTALRYPERVAALVLVDPAIYSGGGTPNWIRPLLRTPQARRLGPLFVRGVQSWGMDFARLAWHNPAKITEEVLEGYRKPLQAQDWDKALWEMFLASRSPELADRLDEIRAPVLVISGDDDRVVPTEDSIRLAGELRDAELVVIPRCGHVPQEECPQEFLKAVENFLRNVFLRNTFLRKFSGDQAYRGL